MHFSPQQKPRLRSSFADNGFIHKDIFGVSYEYFNATLRLRPRLFFILESCVRIIEHIKSIALAPLNVPVSFSRLFNQVGL